MPSFEPSTPWVITLNLLGWPVIQLSFSWVFLRLPPGLFRAAPVPPTVPIERIVYERVLAIKRWKDFLPDGAAWFRGGFSKRRLQRRDAAYLDRFMLESRRGEAAHWAMLLAGPVFMLWNPPWAIAVMFAYALASNLPCIAAQRYNRLRLLPIQRGLNRRRRS